MTSRLHIPRALATTVLCVAAVTGCGAEVRELQAGAEHGEHAPDHTLSGVTTEGTAVLLQTAESPLKVGKVRFAIAFPNGIPADVPVSMDLVSPEMPMMGIRRFEAQKVSASEFIVDGEIMMEGFWNVYVNLGYGADAAEFEFDVEPAAGGMGHDMSAMGMQSADSTADEGGNSHSH